MLTKKIILRAAGASLAAIISLAAQPLGAQTASESERLQKLERAVELLEKRNAELQSEISSLKAQQAAVVPEGKMKAKIISEGKTYVEKVVEEKPPIYVQQRGSEIKLVLGGFIQVNFEDGDVLAFQGNFGQTALKDRFRLRRARISKSKATLSRAMASTLAAPIFREQTSLSTGINSQRRKSRPANGRPRSDWSSLLPTLPCSLSNALCPPARSRLSGRSVFNFGASLLRAFGLIRRIC